MIMLHEELLYSNPNDFDSLPTGDKASSKTNYVWVLEKFHKGRWIPAPTLWMGLNLQHIVRSKRESVRHIARELRLMGHEVRVVPYKMCLDSLGRTNRQVKSERLA